MKTPWANWSLQTRILILTVMISASVLATADWLGSISSVRSVERASHVQTEQIARLLAEDLQQVPENRFSGYFRDRVGDILELEPSVVRIDAYVKDDDELKLTESSSVSGDRDLYPQELDVLYTVKPITFLTQDGNTRHIVSSYPLLFSDGREGFLTVVSSLRAVDDILKIHSRIRLYSIIATTLLLVAAITLLFQTTVYRSVHHLVEVMQRFKVGDSGARAQENLAGEFGELAYQFNGMLDEIQNLNQDLQRRIEEATDELATRNRELQDLNLQLVQAQKELTQAERLALAGQMTATFAHEVGSPLSAVSTHLQMLSEDPEIGNQARNRVQLALDQIDRVCTIVENLLATTRQAYRCIPLDLDQVVDRVIQLMGPTLQSRQIQIELVDTGAPFTVLGDPEQLQQVFLNLLNNAMDAIQGTGKVSVALGRVVADGDNTHNQIRVDLQDSGSGIPSERLERIFEPFFTTKDYGKGTGLGLAVTRYIVDRHGGHISVMSSPEEGTCFTILFPERVEKKLPVVQGNLFESEHHQP